MKAIAVLIVIGLNVGLGFGIPVPQDETSVPEPPLHSEPPSSFANMLNSETGQDSDYGYGTPSDTFPMTEDYGTSTDMPPSASKEEECGHACMLANQTPIILLIVILVLIILLLIVLFGCYFMKKLHGKAIFTTGQRSRIPAQAVGKQFEVYTGPILPVNQDGEIIEKNTTETFTPTGKQIVTTTTTKFVKTIEGGTPIGLPSPISLISTKDEGSKSDSLRA